MTKGSHHSARWNGLPFPRRWGRKMSGFVSWEKGTQKEMLSSPLLLASHCSSADIPPEGRTLSARSDHGHAVSGPPSFLSFLIAHQGQWGTNGVSWTGSLSQLQNLTHSSHQYFLSFQPDIQHHPGDWVRQASTSFSDFNNGIGEVFQPACASSRERPVHSAGIWRAAG